MINTNVTNKKEDFNITTNKTVDAVHVSSHCLVLEKRLLY